LQDSFSPRRRREVYAHRIVYMVHNEEDIPKGLEINHKDGEKHNNHPDNLEMVTHKENGRHAARVLKRNCGEACSRAKLTEPEVLEIRRLYDEGVPRKRIARMFGVHPSNVTHIGRRRIWKHI
jgi:hypothetical protein